MAYIQKGSCGSFFLTERRSVLFTNPYGPGREAPCSGIYRCICHREILCHAGKNLPWCDEHDIATPISWRLVVSIEEIPDTVM